MRRSGPHHEALVPEEHALTKMPSSLASKSKSVTLINCTEAAALLPTVQWVTCSVLPSHCSAWRTTAQLWSKEPWCAHQRGLLRWPVFPLASPETSIWYFLGWAERSSLAITSCLVNILSSMTVSCQELWSQEELTSTRLLDKNPGFITAEPEPLQWSKFALLAWSQAETLLSFNQLHRYFSLIDY